jgi:hypothetical protein
MITTERSGVKRLPKRGAYDAETIHAILDAAFVAHVGFVVNGQPLVIPTLYGRQEGKLFLHGSAASRMLRELDKGRDLCHGDAGGCAGAGAIGVSSFDELPVGRRVRAGAADW